MRKVSKTRASKSSSHCESEMFNFILSNFPSINKLLFFRAENKKFLTFYTRGARHGMCVSPREFIWWALTRSIQENKFCGFQVEARAREVEWEERKKNQFFHVRKKKQRDEMKSKFFQFFFSTRQHRRSQIFITFAIYKFMWLLCFKLFFLSPSTTPALSSLLSANDDDDIIMMERKKKEHVIGNRERETYAFIKKL